VEGVKVQLGCSLFDTRPELSGNLVARIGDRQVAGGGDVVVRPAGSEKEHSGGCQADEEPASVTTPDRYIAPPPARLVACGC
jgi:hypothetical protein